MTYAASSPDCEPVCGLDRELRLSPGPVLLIFVALGLAFVFSIEAHLDPAQVYAIIVVMLAVMTLSAAATALHARSPIITAWLVVVQVEAVVFAGLVWLDMPGFLALAGLPVTLALMMISPRAAIAVALSETLALLALSQHGVRVATLPGTLLLTIMATWGMLALLLAQHRQLSQLQIWTQDYLKLAHDLVREQRDRKAELAQTMEDLMDANRQLTRMNILAHGLRQAAEQARLAKERFVANVSHELRTPLNMIIGYGQMIMESPEAYGDGISPALLADLGVICRNAEHLSGLVDDVLDLSQIEANHMALSREFVDFAAVVDTAVSAIKPLFTSKRLYLDVSIDEGLPPVLCDEARIRQVLLNLLGNAGRFADQGGVTVRVCRERDGITVSVADTGPGIAPKDQGRVFQPFQQVDDSLRRRHGGTGLGLSISKSFIELHGGTMWFESQPSAGTTFYFHLPVESPTGVDRDGLSWFNPHVQYEERTRPSLAKPPVLRPRVTVLDSTGSLQRMLKRYLDEFEVGSVHDLAEAIADLQARPSLALLVNALSPSGDVQPADLAKLPYGTPVVTCSLAGAAESTGAPDVCDYLVKPISRERLLAALDRLHLEGHTVLIVDDEPEALRLFRRMLASSERQYRVLRASDGAEALEVLNVNKVDAILLDLFMPNLDGFQLLATKNQCPSLRDIPVIIISARDPAGQPIVSSGLAIKREGGLTAQQLLACIRAVSEILSPSILVDGPERPGGPGG